MRVLIIDDHPAFGDQLVKLLAKIPAVEVAGRAGDGREGLRLAAELKPDLALVDFCMPELDGLGVTRELKTWANPPKVVMMSMNEGPEFVRLALAAGADAFMSKMSLSAQLAPLLARLGAER
jgi:DNA-binding NarL/FixJ family response regulator